MSEYRVLARKYRPETFADLVGQEALVRTLSNAIATGRIAHAFLLTGIRGIGKTTTARIIARALNCIGTDGQGGATATPCGVCPNCVQIREDRHPDVIEMDAASRTGVGDIRELIDTVHYRPTQARYKIYIIDEVHMLSTNAFNALLKTLEEPPPHVIFVFATTEIHKIPVTILSRCQRFDLRRLDTEGLTAHLKDICARENVTAEEEALMLIATAAEGSVRDSLSLLDRAISHSSTDTGNLHVTGETVRGMLGLADRTRLFDLLEAMLSGDAAAALDLLRTHYRDGADMVLLFQNLLHLVHLVTQVRIDAALANNPAYSQNERERSKSLAGKLPMPEITRAWQLLSKGLDEIRRSFDTRIAAEMLCVRLAYASTLPSPGEVIATLKESGSLSAATGSSAARPLSSAAPRPTGGGSASFAAAAMSTPATVPEPVMMEAAPPHLSLAAANPAVSIQTFEALTAWLEKQREPMLFHQLVNHARLVSFEEGEAVFSRSGGLPADFCGKLSAMLTRATDRTWKVTLSDDPGAATPAEQRKAYREQLQQEAAHHPLVQEVMRHFPGAKIITVREQ